MKIKISTKRRRAVVHGYKSRRCYKRSFVPGPRGTHRPAPPVFKPKETEESKTTQGHGGGGGM